jgi:hypothetical protein
MGGVIHIILNWWLMFVVTRYISGLISSRTDHSCLSNQRRGKYMTSLQFPRFSFIYDIKVQSLKHIYHLHISLEDSGVQSILATTAHYLFQEHKVTILNA